MGMKQFGVPYANLSIIYVNELQSRTKGFNTTLFGGGRTSPGTIPLVLIDIASASLYLGVDSIIVTASDIASSSMYLGELSILVTLTDSASLSSSIS